MVVDRFQREPFEFDTRSEPLTGRLDFVEGAEHVLPDGFLGQLTGCLTFDNPSLTPINAGGRSYFVRIPESVGPYDTLQVSGGGYIDTGVRTMRGSDGLIWPRSTSNKIEPPRKDFETFEPAGTSYMDNTGEFIIDYSTSIYGT